MGLLQAAGRAVRAIGRGFNTVASDLERDRMRYWYGPDWERLAAQRTAGLQYMLQKQAEEQRGRELENISREQRITQDAIDTQRKAEELTQMRLGNYRSAAVTLMAGAELPSGQAGPPAPVDFSSLQTAGLPLWAQQNPRAVQAEAEHAFRLGREKEAATMAGEARAGDRFVLDQRRFTLDQERLAETRAYHEYLKANHIAPTEKLTLEQRAALETWNQAMRQEAEKATLRGEALTPELLAERVGASAGALLAGRKRYLKNLGIPVPGGLRGATIPEPDDSGVIDLGDGVTVVEEP